MNDGGHPPNAAETSSPVLTMTEQISNLSVNGDAESSVGTQMREKDPRIIARKYQMDICQKALSENTIAYLGTGCGKTHIAILLMNEMRHLIKKPQKNICVFLAPTVALVEQQARVIEDSIDFKVGTYCGSTKRLKGHHDWEKEIDQYEVLVMTPQILLHNLSHCFIRIEVIALLIFDECHYAQLESNHPYAEIMKVFYKSDVVKLPRIFGMTASPIYGKGASVNSLETLLHAKVYSVEDTEELEQFVTSPEVKVYYYTSATNSLSSPQMIYSEKLEDIKRKCISLLSKKTPEHSSLRSTKKALQRLHGNLIFCLENLGVWGALKATHILLRGDHFERNELMEEEGQSTNDSLCDRYLDQAASVFASDCMKDGSKAELTNVEVLQEPFFSRKLLRLIHILSNFRIRPKMKCIVFVNRIVTARSLSCILRDLKFLSSWKCNFLVGVHSGLKCGSRKTTNIILDKFRSGELNLLVATKVGEEGLDIQTCCLVIRFDLPETVASFIQSRGRARMPQSEYAFLVDSENQKELKLIQNFKKNEDQMNEEIACRTSTSTSVCTEEKTYKVYLTGATVSSGSSISLLHHYCSKLPHDEYFNPKPQFFYFDDVEGTVCHIILPSNSPVHQIGSSPQSSIEAAKKDACLQACKELHQLGALTNYLLPDQDDDKELKEYSSDSDSCDDEESRRELHEMLVPAALKEPWNKLEDSVCLNSYFIKFSPHPMDRSYKNFGLFVKKPLPEEAERMKLDLSLARGRHVETELVPSTVTRFDKDETVLAEKYQEMFLKIIIDRSEFIHEFVSLGKTYYINSSSGTFYLMLPVIWNEYEGTMTVDWKLVRRCLSSPIFRMPEIAGDDGHPHLKNHLHLVNGPKSIDDVVNSLIYAPCKNLFFFVTGVVLDKNGYSEFKESMNFVEHYSEMFNIHLSHPNQPLLKVKQLFCLDNLLRKKGHSESRKKEEHFIELPAEICQLKIIGFSKDIGSSLSLLPSIMHRLESLLVAIELKHRLSASFAEGAEVTASRVLEALTTETCHERFSLERLEVLGDAFLKFAVGRNLFLLHDAFDEGQLTRKRSNIVNNCNLHKLAISNNLQVYIRDQSFDPCQFFALGRPCSVICCKEIEKSIHSPNGSTVTNCANLEVRCNKCHHWLHKKTIADVVEALVGAFIVDSGFKAATAFLSWIGIQVDFEPSLVDDICSASTIYMPLSNEIDIVALENLLGYQFIHKGLLIQAFIHPSYNSHGGGCYQRLEFLGDAVLDYLITSYLYSVYPKLKPGQLTDLRSISVNNDCFAGIAIKRSFRKFILCDSDALCQSMDKYIDFVTSSASVDDVVEAPKCPKALGDLVESCIGAILLDTGFDLDRVWKIMLSFLDPVMSFSRFQLHPIRELQELCQSYNWELNFVTSKNDKVFSVEVKVDGKDVCGAAACATNLSRKAAKSTAAKQIISTFKAQGYKSKNKSLEDIVKVSRKMEARLIGYDEKSTKDIAPCAAGSDNLKVEQPSACSSKVNTLSVERTKLGSPKVKLVRNSPSRQVVSELQEAGGMSKKSARSLMYEVCAANCWKPPIFECCNETGPSHLKEFTFKVLVELDEAECPILECIGDPSANKKDAAENAAQGAVWYLRQYGYLLTRA